MKYNEVKYYESTHIQKKKCFVVLILHPIRKYELNIIHSFESEK